MYRELDKKIREREEPVGTALRSPEEIEQIIVLGRLHLYNCGLPCGAAAWRRYLRAHNDLQPLPSVRQIGQVLTRYGLTYGRTGWYEGDEPEWLPGSTTIPISERRRVILAQCAAP